MLSNASVKVWTPAMEVYLYLPYRLAYRMGKTVPVLNCEYVYAMGWHTDQNSSFELMNFTK